jgi:hypothetical protein
MSKLKDPKEYLRGQSLRVRSREDERAYWTRLYGEAAGKIQALTKERDGLREALKQALGLLQKTYDNNSYCTFCGGYNVNGTDFHKTGCPLSLALDGYLALPQIQPCSVCGSDSVYWEDHKGCRKGQR